MMLREFLFVIGVVGTLGNHTFINRTGCDWLSDQFALSYKSGRNETAVNERYTLFKAAVERNAGLSELNNICGRIDDCRNFEGPKCATKIGRPRDEENIACDTWCCHAGFKVGNCGDHFDEDNKLNWKEVIGGLLPEVIAILTYSSNKTFGDLDTSGFDTCICSNDWRDVRCGRDGSVFGIRCPFDQSSCWRKCCREGRSGGKCSGFLKLTCTCDE